jgi:hypothetical protein
MRRRGLPSPDRADACAIAFAGRANLLASLIPGVLWAFWHLPFVVTGEDIWLDALLFPIEWSIVYIWLFNNAKGSVLIVMLFHNMNYTFSSGFVGRMFSGADSVNQARLRLALWAVVALVLVVVYGSHHLSRKHKKQVEPAQPEVPAASPHAVRTKDKTELSAAFTGQRSC